MKSNKLFPVWARKLKGTYAIQLKIQGPRETLEVASMR